MANKRPKPEEIVSSDWRACVAQITGISGARHHEFCGCKTAGAAIIVDHHFVS